MHIQTCTQSRPCFKSPVLPPPLLRGKKVGNSVCIIPFHPAPQQSAIKLDALTVLQPRVLVRQQAQRWLMRAQGIAVRECTWNTYVGAGAEEAEDAAAAAAEAESRESMARLDEVSGVAVL